jgi:hypothetical protein
MSSRKSQYLFYTEYYLISGAYHIVNVVNGVLTYTASCSDHIKGYLENKVISKKTILNELVYNNSVSVKNNDTDVDEDGFVVIKMRRPKIKNDTTTNAFSDVVINPTKTTAINLDNNLDQLIVTNILNGILDKLDYLDLDGRMDGRTDKHLKQTYDNNGV